MWAWNDHSKKDVLVEMEQFTHSGSLRRRPVTVVGLIRISGAARSSANAAPLAYNYAGAQNEDRLFDTEAGHIMGLRLGGVNAQENVVPMHAHVNRDLFRDVERAVEAVYRTGRQMGVEYTLAYGGADGRVPSAIGVRVLSNLAFPDGTAMTFPGGAHYAHDAVAVYTTAVPQAAPVIARILPDPHRLVIFQTARAAVAGGWLLEEQVGECADWFTRGALPPPGQRPYAFLDYLYFDSRAPGGFPIAVGTIGKFREFDAEQRGYVVLANRHLQTGPKVGECWSDAADDPVKTALVQLGADSGIEIDHIVPKSRGGCNAFSNAQVTSRKYNGAKNNTAG